MSSGDIRLYSLGLPQGDIPQPNEPFGCDPLSRIKCVFDLAGFDRQPLSSYPERVATESMGLRCLAAAVADKERAQVITPLSTIPARIGNDISKLVAITDAPFPLGIALLVSNGALVYLSNNADYHLQPVPVPGRVVDVAAGAEHAVACTESGDVYVWGFGNSWGQQGDGTVWRDTSECRDETKYDDVTKALQLSYPKRLVCFGSQLPQSQDNFAALAAFKPAPIDQVACGRYHTLFLSSAKKVVYSCGWGGSGQLGHGKTWELSPSPRALKKLFGCDIASIHASPNSDHSIVVQACGKTLVFGEGKQGVLGSGTTKDIWEPTPVVAKEAKHAALHQAADSEARFEGDGETVDNTIARINKDAFLFPRRVPRTSNVLEAGDVATLHVSTSETHTCILVGTATILTCGLGGPIRLPMKDRTNLRVCPRKNLPPRSGSGVIESLASPSSRLVDAIGAIGRRPMKTSDLFVFDEVEVQTGGEKAAVLRGDIEGGPPTVLPIAGKGFTLFVDPEGKRRSVRMVGTICDASGRVVFGSGMKSGHHNTGSIEVATPGAVERVFPFVKGAILAVRE